MMNNEIRYSIIIPTLNEEENISRLLSDIKLQSRNNSYAIEVIVADGGSQDRTVEISKKYNTIIVSGEKGRGKQLKSGADVARGKYFLFLHADLVLPQNIFTYLDQNFNESKKISTFRMKLDEDKALYKIYEFFTRFDSVFSTFGDQGIIVSRSFYFQIGGFKDIPIMEDVEFFSRVRKRVKIIKMDEYVIVSSRVFKKVGTVKTQLRSFIYILKYFMGADPEILYKNYYKNQDEEKRDNHFPEISRIGKSQNQISFYNK